MTRPCRHLQLPVEPLALPSASEGLDGGLSHIVSPQNRPRTLHCPICPRYGLVGVFPTTRQRPFLDRFRNPNVPRMLCVPRAPTVLLFCSFILHPRSLATRLPLAFPLRQGSPEPLLRSTLKPSEDILSLSRTFCTQLLVRVDRTRVMRKHAWDNTHVSDYIYIPRFFFTPVGYLYQLMHRTS
ncbi:hypothetical protein BGW80DRAFT_1333556 [Lactifluus volemus]|nr:hypothetical protein BGW80DRAFT_1333556 [Lactifluus volemus]